MAAESSAARAATLLALCLAWSWGASAAAEAGAVAGAGVGAGAGAGAGVGAGTSKGPAEPGHVLAPRGGACPSPAAAPVAHAVTQLLVDYARWRAWKEVVLFVTKARWCEARAAALALSAEGVAVGLQPVAGALLPAAFHVPRHRLGAVLLPGARDDDVAALLAEVSHGPCTQTRRNLNGRHVIASHPIASPRSKRSGGE
ncbi:hypothetical protein R5R35_014816 [Gryllus longicercus]|uniref:Uncharacterized protein n=1 Tax=Gryllus longicercus TaxID=2509291 RepID=A0AAN9VQA2_9ORTH